MDRFVRIKKIGEGSFGKALLVKSKENGKQYVVKEINMSKMARKEREDARKEVAVLAQLGHPNIVTYKESFEETGNLFIVMDYCDGGDLYSRINTQKGVLFPEDQVLDWLVQISLSVKHIHDRKILHRDIKSQNIFLTRHGIVKLGDFGIAKVLNSTVELARTCIGTPYYLSPEICENKPYNNKSDIWSLGCVLYELTTLKHAFEAGCMKNLVLKIIRGSYPPVSAKYSYELRNLLALLFKRSPRDRPSINAVLRKPILQRRIQKFLSEPEMSEEFSHTVMHGQRIKKEIPVGKPRPMPQPQIVKKPPTPAAKYNPSSVYGPSVGVRKSASKENRGVRKSGDVVKKSSNEVRKSNEVRRSSDAVNKRPSGGNLDLVKKKQEMLDKERQRRDAARRALAGQPNPQQAFQKKHQEMLEKQRLSRMKKAREEGWKNLMGSLSSDEGDKRPPSGPAKNEEPKKPPASPKPAGGGAGRGQYDHYHDMFSKLDQQRQEPPSARPVSAQPAGRPPIAGIPAFNPVAAAKQGAAAAVKGAQAADKAKVVNEFQQRKAAAAAYKARGQGDLFGGVGAVISPRPVGRPVVPAATPISGPGRSPSSSKEEPKKEQEEDYLTKLRQIRLQNFNERRNVKERPPVKVDAKYKPSSHDEEADIRRKKIEALRQQADDRVKKLKEDLEKKRKDQFERLRPGAKPVMAPKPAVALTPAKPSVPMTEAMKAIGAARLPVSPSPVPEKPAIGMTAAMNAIGAGSTPVGGDSTSDSKSPLKAKKKKVPTATLR